MKDYSKCPRECSPNIKILGRHSNLMSTINMIDIGKMKYQNQV